MQPETPLLRQVHPQWFKDGHVVSLAFLGYECPEPP